MKIVLKEEVNINGHKVKELEMREPKVMDMINVGTIKNDVEKEVVLIGNLTNLTKDEVSELPFSAYKQLQENLSLYL